MIDIHSFPTIGKALFEAARLWCDKPFIAVPENPTRSWHPQGLEWSYSTVAGKVQKLAKSYIASGYGEGHRIGLLLENRPEHLLHKLAINQIGACCVPLNPDYRPREMAYVIEHTKMDLVVVVSTLRPLLEQAINESSHRPHVVLLDDSTSLPKAVTSATSHEATSSSIASVLYTSGTTGRPKGCMLSHQYELAAGAWYATRGGVANFDEACERIYNPLPVFHINSSVFSFFCAMLKGNCQIQTDRFQASRWFDEVYKTRATVVHYLGVVVPVLLNQPTHPHERSHRVKFAIGAGIDPQRHAEFEDRFGYPLVEIWGMTEWVRAIFDTETPRRVGTRAFGRVQPGMEIRIVDDNDQDVPPGIPGELLVRDSANTPRKECFSGYLYDTEATEHAWRGGWFHTGDIVTADTDGLLHFVERRKNIIRRSGENIAAAEVEAVLQSHPFIAQAAVLAAPDEVREEEVLACIVLKPNIDRPTSRDQSVIKELMTHCMSEMAYNKAPGWLWFTDEIPITGTQKIQKHQIFEGLQDPRTASGMIDVRPMKIRTPTKKEPS